MLGNREVLWETVWSSSWKKTSKFEILNILLRTVDRNLECSTKCWQLYGMWWGSTILPARQKKIFEWVWTCIKWIKFECQVLHLSEFAHWNQICNSRIRNEMIWNNKKSVSEFKWPVSTRYYILIFEKWRIFCFKRDEQCVRCWCVQSLKDEDPLTAKDITSWGDRRWNSKRVVSTTLHYICQRKFVERFRIDRAISTWITIIFHMPIGVQ